MNKQSFLMLIVVSAATFGQQSNQTEIIRKDSVEYNHEQFSSLDSKIDSINRLIIENVVGSVFMDEIKDYYLPVADTLDVAEIPLDTELLKERLSIINQTTPFHITYHPALEKTIKSHLKHRTKYYPSFMARAAYYFPMIETYLDHYDIPLEMKYLALVESALKPKAKSRVGATGLWQFMYSTGKQYGLKVSSYVDERQDPVKSTIAACQYLNDLYAVFDDWNLAIAAYNSGPGNVTKAIRRSGGRQNYWNLRPFLPRETADYIPAFHATLYLFMYADEHHLNGNTPEIHYFETDTVQVKRTVSFDQISQITGIETSMLEFLNPSYKLKIIPYISKRNYAVRIPTTQTDTLLKNEKELYLLAGADDAKREKPLPRYFEMDSRIRYRVRSGDYLGKIARRYGVRISDLKRWNGLKSSFLRIGQRLTIYPKRP